MSDDHLRQLERAAAAGDPAAAEAFLAACARAGHDLEGQHVIVAHGSPREGGSRAWRTCRRCATQVPCPQTRGTPAIHSLMGALAAIDEGTILAVGSDGNVRPMQPGDDFLGVALRAAADAAGPSALERISRPVAAPVLRDTFWDDMGNEPGCGSGGNTGAGRPWRMRDLARPEGPHPARTATRDAKARARARRGARRAR